MLAAQRFFLAGVFLIRYSLSLGYISYMGELQSIEYFIDFSLFINKNFLNAIIFVRILNLAGVPPFFGFYVKVLIILQMLDNAQGLLIVLLILSAGVFVYIYLRTSLYKLENFFIRPIVVFQGSSRKLARVLVIMYLGLMLLCVLYVSIITMGFESINNKEIYYIYFYIHRSS